MRARRGGGDQLRSRGSGFTQRFAVGGEPVAVVVAAELERLRGLGARDGARQLRRRRRGVARDGAGGVDAGRDRVRQVNAAVRVPARPGAGLEQQRGRRHGAPGDRDQVAVDPALGVGDRVPAGVEPGDDGAAHATASECTDDRARAHDRDPRCLDPLDQALVTCRRPRVDDADHRDAGLRERESRFEAAVAAGRDQGGVSGPHAVEGREPLRARAQHHPRQVVALEQQRLLDRAGRRHVAVGADLVQRVAGPHGNEPVEEAQRRRRSDDLDPRGFDPRRKLARRLGAGPGQLGAAELGPVVDEDDVGPHLRRPHRRRHPGDAATDHEHVGMAAAVLGAPLAVALAAHQSAEAGRVAEDPLVQRPQAARPDEGLVVEARRGEGAAEQVGGPHQIEPQRRPRVHVGDLHALADRLGAGAHPGPAVDLDEAVRALAGAAHEPARAVVLEASREHPAAVRVQGRADRVALERGNHLAVERERDRPIASDAAPRPWREAAHRPGSPTQCTSFVIVSRSARNHARQPERWYHHSRWTPATLRRK